MISFTPRTSTAVFPSAVLYAAVAAAAALWFIARRASAPTDRSCLLTLFVVALYYVLRAARGA